MYKQVINTKINLQEFFDVYPPLSKEKTEETNKYQKLFSEPLRRGTIRKSLKIKKLENTLLPSNQGLKSIKEIPNDSANNMTEKSENSAKENKSIENINKKYFLISEGLKLQKQKLKRNHSLRKSLQTFLYSTTLIEKLNENLYSIENNLNGGYVSKNDINLQKKIKSKIQHIVEKLSNRLKIERVKENQFIIKMNEIGDKCYFLLNGKLSILKPVQYKNVSITTNEYIHYLISLLKYNEISLINKVIEINHIFINIESISNLKILSKGFFLRKADSYLETFKTITKEDFINLLDEFFLKFEDFNLEPEQTWKDIEDINDNNFIEYSDSSDSESEKNDLEEEKKEKKERKEKKEKKEIRSKYMIFKDYMNKFNLKVEERVVLTNFNFLFNPFEQKKKYNLILFKYELFLNLFPGSFFGDMALEAKVKKRNATIRTEEECFILSLNNDDYISLLYEDNQKLKSMDLVFLTNKFFFKEMSPVIFEKYYFAKFKYIEKYKGDIIYIQNNPFTSVLFLKKGEYNLEVKMSVIDIHNLIKFFIDMIEENNFLKYSSKYISDLKETYLKDTELFTLKDINKNFQEKFNEKYRLDISTVKQNEILGDLEYFLTSGYIYTCTVISEKAEYLEIQRQDLLEIFNKEKDILPSYYKFVMNKIVSQIKRFFYLKTNLMNQIKSKIKNSFYHSMVSPNFYDQQENNNTNQYFKDKLSLKKSMPKIFKYSHIAPPIIYNSNWKPKFFEQEKNDLYNFYHNNEINLDKNKDNNININISVKIPEIKNYENMNENEINKKWQDNNNLMIIQESKIIEDISTTKTKNNSLIYNSNNERPNQNITCRNKNPFGLNKETVIAGKYQLSLKKLTEEFSNIENHDPLNLNIVNKLKSDKGITSSFSINNINNINSTKKLHSSASNSFLPPIRLYKQKNIMNLYKKSKNSSSDKLNKSNYELNQELNNYSLLNDEININNKKEISKAVKNFYEKQKLLGYSSIINKNNNRYYKAGRSNSIK